MKNVHLLPTDKLSSLFKDIKGNLGFNTEWNEIPLGRKNQHIYITSDASDEDIKKGEYQIYNPLGNFDNAKVSKAERLLENDGRRKKIILTTDQDLIKDGVQAIDDAFLEWFAKNPTCEWVEVKKVEGRYVDYGGNVHNPISYKIIIPQEVNKNQQTEQP